MLHVGLEVRLARGQGEVYGNKSDSRNPRDAAGLGATTPGALGRSPGLRPGLIGLCRTCWPALAQNTCTPWLPRAQELFEMPYPVWELFQTKAMTLPCIKTIFLRWRKRKGRRLARILASKKLYAYWAVPCLVAPALCVGSSPPPASSVAWRTAVCACQARRTCAVVSWFLAIFSLLIPHPLLLFLLSFNKHGFRATLCPACPRHWIQIWFLSC